MIILLLVQDKKNRSVQMLDLEIRKQMQSQSLSCRLLVWEIKDVQFSEDNALLISGDQGISIQEIALVIKRTWGPIREKGLSICQTLEDAGVSVLNGCALIRWTHSKVQQYQTLTALNKAHLYPKTVYIEEVPASTIALTKTFPMILKKDKGCRADGIYLIDSQQTLDQLLASDDSLQCGFLLQEFIHSNDNPLISNYYRINVVAGVVQSAVQFQLMWSKVEGSAALKLEDFEAAEDVPVDVAMFPQQRLQAIISACPYSQDVVGIDVMFDGEQLYLLEFNDGPAVSAVDDLGRKFLQTHLVGVNKPAQCCQDFAVSIARLCVERALQFVLPVNKVFTINYDNGRLPQSPPNVILTQDDERQRSQMGLGSQ